MLEYSGASVNDSLHLGRYVFSLKHRAGGGPSHEPVQHSVSGRSRSSLMLRRKFGAKETKGGKARERFSAV